MKSWEKVTLHVHAFDGNSSFHAPLQGKFIVKREKI